MPVVSTAEAPPSHSPSHPHQGQAQAPPRSLLLPTISLASLRTCFFGLKLRDWARWAGGQVQLGFWPQGLCTVMGSWDTKTLYEFWLCFQVMVTSGKLFNLSRPPFSQVDKGEIFSSH